MNGRLLRRSELTDRERRAMYGLLETYFEGVGPEQFRRDLDEKNWVILVTNEAGDIQGFTTILHYDTTYNGEPVGIVCSGDTIVDRSARESNVLAKTWLSAIDRFGREHPRNGFYWLLLCSGYRTYRFLPVFWLEFHPRHDRPVPAGTRALLDSLATERFGEMYDREAGVVRFPSPQLLRDPTVPQRRMHNRHVSFFASRNPGHAQGDELVCIAEMSRENQTPVGLRLGALSAGQ